jgi:hypothetical protein
MIKKYFGLTLSYGFMRGLFYNYNRKDICLNDKIPIVIASGIITPAYFLSNLTDDFTNFNLYINGNKIIRK